MDLLKDEIRKARKQYKCGAYHWIDRSNFGERDFEPEDWEKVKMFLDNGGMIQIGEPHIYQVSIDGGEFYVFRANEIMNQVCIDYSLYPED